MTHPSKTETIRVDQHVAAPPEQVWRMLTESELLRLWFAEAFDRMGAGWRDLVMPRLAASAERA